MIDETPGLVGCEDADGNRVYRKKYFWSITAKVLKLSWLFYEEGSRGAKAIKPYLEKFIGFYTTDRYVCCKVFDMTDENWRNWKVLLVEESRRGVLVSFTFDVCLLTHWKRTTMRRCGS